MRIHAFLEHWGLINFNVDPSSKPNNPLLPKAFNYKSPVYVDASSFMVKGNLMFILDSVPNYGNKIGENAVILTKNGEDLKTLYPINSNPENLFRTIFNKNSLSALNQVNFLAKNYRPKCDICSQLCNMEWYMQKNQDVKSCLLICETCYESNSYPKDFTKDDFEIANFFNIINPSESNL
jgi:hypothetical protein